MDLLFTAPSAEPAGLLASRLALAGDSGECPPALVEGLGEGDIAEGLEAFWVNVSMASPNRHFTSSACGFKEVICLV